jgi:hypothetical protein
MRGFVEPGALDGGCIRGLLLRPSGKTCRDPDGVARARTLDIRTATRPAA